MGVTRMSRTSSVLLRVRAVQAPLLALSRGDVLYALLEGAIARHHAIECLPARHRFELARIGREIEGLKLRTLAEGDDLHVPMDERAASVVVARLGQIDDHVPRLGRRAEELSDEALALEPRDASAVDLGGRRDPEQLEDRRREIDGAPGNVDLLRRGARYEEEERNVHQVF